MNGKTRNTLMGVAGAMLSAAILREGFYRSMDRKMVGEALDRHEPRTIQRIKQRIRGSAEDWETNESLSILAECLRSRPHEQICITASDGTKLAGHLFRVKNPQRVIVAMHGWRSDWARDFGMVSEFFERNSCTVLYAEQRGQGNSGGDYMGFGMIERYDCLDWVSHLNKMGYHQMPMYLAGISMGATTVLMTAGFTTELPENLNGIIADCGFTSAREIWNHICEQNLRHPFFKREKQLRRLCRKRIDLEPDAYTTLDAMQTCRTPVLFIHGAADTFVPMEMTLENYQACRAPKRLLIVDNANHGMSYVLQRKKYEKTVMEFWQEFEKSNVQNA